MIKENFKIRVITKSERLEARDLFKSIGCKDYCIRVGDGEFITPNMTEITLPELRELARPKEYLNDKYELVVTNQPESGWILVPDIANRYTKSICGHLTFWDNSNSILVHGRAGMSGRYTYGYYTDYYKAKILWQRTKEETKMKGRDGNAGRFLHQEWYEAFGRGEDVEVRNTRIGTSWEDLTDNFSISWFNMLIAEFRLKPRTITINGHEINAPIDVKPERGTRVFVVQLALRAKQYDFIWQDSAEDKIVLERNICHLTGTDALDHANAMLDFKKDRMI